MDVRYGVGVRMMGAGWPDYTPSQWNARVSLGAPPFDNSTMDPVEWMQALISFQPPAANFVQGVLNGRL